MSKSTITKLFVTSIIACVTGAILVSLGWFAFPNDVFVKHGSQIIGVQGSAFALAMVSIGAAGALILVGAAIAGFASWIGALLNTAALERKRWFIGLALFGVFNCGLLAVAAYVVAGPDGTRRANPGPALATASAS
jgi:hypothetical protein